MYHTLFNKWNHLYIVWGKVEYNFLRGNGRGFLWNLCKNELKTSCSTKMLSQAIFTIYQIMLLELDNCVCVAICRIPCEEFTRSNWVVWVLRRGLTVSWLVLFNMNKIWEIFCVVLGWKLLSFLPFLHLKVHFNLYLTLKYNLQNISLI